MGERGELQECPAKTSRRGPSEQGGEKPNATQGRRSRPDGARPVARPADRGRRVGGVRCNTNLVRGWQVDLACSFQDPKGYRAEIVTANLLT